MRAFVELVGCGFSEREFVDILCARDGVSRRRVQLLGWRSSWLEGFAVLENSRIGSKSGPWRAAPFQSMGARGCQPAVALTTSIAACFFTASLHTSTRVSASCEDLCRRAQWSAIGRNRSKQASKHPRPARRGSKQASEPAEAGVAPSKQAKQAIYQTKQTSFASDWNRNFPN